VIKRDELKGPSCLTNAADDEPIFVLKSTDELAPGIVRQWAQEYWMQKGGYARMTEKQVAKYQEALLLSEKMEAWLSHQA
jgi:hypothetical protein